MCLPAPLQDHIATMTVHFAITKLMINIFNEVGLITCVFSPDSPKQMAHKPPGIQLQPKIAKTPYVRSHGLNPFHVIVISGCSSAATTITIEWLQHLRWKNKGFAWSGDLYDTNNIYAEEAYQK